MMGSLWKACARSLAVEGTRSALRAKRLSHSLPLCVGDSIRGIKTKGIVTSTAGCNLPFFVSCHLVLVSNDFPHESDLERPVQRYKAEILSSRIKESYKITVV